MGFGGLLHEIGTTRVYDIRGLIAAARERESGHGVAAPLSDESS
jgi:hypothetical protein